MDSHNELPHMVYGDVTLWASARQNLSSGFLTKPDSIQSPQLQRLISSVAILYIILPKIRTKVLISMRGCAGWSAPLLFSNTKDRLSHVEAHYYKAKPHYMKV